MDETKYIMIFVTAASLEEANEISLTLVEEKFVACASTVGNVGSLYWWNGQIENADEQLIVFKTLASHLDAVIARVKSLHSYEVPEIIALPIYGGNPEYLKWIEESVRP
jgi:periplasmic divalent cation tolerance protein